MTTTTTHRNEIDLDRLARVWSRKPGFRGWLTAVDHQSVGARYIATGFAFFLMGGVAALAIRIQLAVPGANFLDPELYNQVFTMHGTTMMFLFAVPILEGVAIYFLPLMIGSRDLAFPRLNAFGYWVYLTGGVTLWIALLFGTAPDAGWTNIVPLAGSRFSAGFNVDFYAAVVTMIEIATIVAAIEIIVSVAILRTPGMTWNRLPLYVWAMLVTAVMIVFAMTPLAVAGMLLESDRKLATHFFNVAGGGEPLLWQHLFWFFGHPEVYIILLPALGMVTAIVATAARRPIIGYPWVVLSFVAIGIVSFGVWVHHMFATGTAPWAMSLFSVASMTIVIPSGIQIFSALATMWHGTLRFSVPLLWAFGFVVVFVLGGMTGVMAASIPINQQIHDTHFIVAHFHYVIIGGMVFPLLGGLYHWFPKLTGRLLDDRLGVASFACIFAGVNITFMPLHLLGMWGMTRRSYTYLPGLGWDWLNQVASVGAGIVAIGVLLYVVNALKSLAVGTRAPWDPWGGGTLEWATASPPLPYNFSAPPIVSSREPLWHRRDRPPGDGELAGGVPHRGTVWLADDRRELLITSAGTENATEPEQRMVQVEASPVPMVAAATVAVIFIGMIYDPLWVPVGLAGLVVALVWWHRPATAGWNQEPGGPPPGTENDWLVPPLTADAGGQGLRTPAWWGAMGAATVLVVIALTLVSSHLFLRAHHEVWPLSPMQPRGVWVPIAISVPLLISVVPLRWARHRLHRGDSRSAQRGLMAAAVLATGFAVAAWADLAGRDYNQTTNVTASLEMVITWLFVGLAGASAGLFLIVVGLIGRGLVSGSRPDPATVAVVLGTTVALAWLPLLAVLHLLPESVG